MKKALLAVLMLMGCSPAFALTFGDLKDQIIGQTKLTLHKSGGPASFYDLSTGNDSSFRNGVIDHVLTNRFVTLDLGWSGADNEEGIIVAGPGINVTEAIADIFPNASEKAKEYLVPPILNKLYVGFNTGWGVDNGSFHYGFNLGYNF